MPPITFEDSQPQPKGVRLGDLKERDTYLPHPCSPLSQVVEVLGQTADNYTIIRGFDGATSGKCDANEIVYPVAVKMVRADAPGCDAAKQIVEDARALRAELEDARKVAAVSERYATAFQDDLKAAKTELAQVSDARDVWMGAAQYHKADADKLRAELEKVKAELRDTQQKASKYRFDSEQWTLIAKSQFREVERLKPELTTVTTERDAWKARAEAYSGSVIHKKVNLFKAHGEDKLCFFYAENAVKYYDSRHNIPPAPTTTDPERVTQDQPNHKRFS